MNKVIDTESKRTILNYLTSKSANKIGLFGSFARNEENPDSDIDLLVNFDRPIGLIELVKIELELEELLGKQVDLVTEKSLKNEKLIKYISDDLIDLLDEEG